MLCLTALTLCAAPARAGSYAVSYSGGSYETYGEGTQPDYDGGGGDYSAGPAASIQSTFTVTCTWVPADPNNPQADPPPQNVILDETGVAYWEAQGGTTTAGGSCSDGLGDPAVPNTDSLPYLLSGSPQLANDHYSVHTGGASFSFQRTPTVSSGGDNHGYMIYSVGVSPITIDLTGYTSVGGAYKALTGQQITAKFNTNGGGGTVSNYQWSTIGGDPFYTWSPTWPNPNSDLGGTQKVALDYNNYLNNSHGEISFYDAGNDEVTVHCTATLTFPDGTSAQVTGMSAPVLFEKPTLASALVDQPFDNFSPGFSPGTGLINDGFSQQHLWSQMKVQEPLDLANANNPGFCVLCQTVSTTRRWYRITSNPILYPQEIGAFVVILKDGTVSEDDQPNGLDGSFPYAYGFTPTPDGNFITCTSLYGWFANKLGFSGDRPTQAYIVVNPLNGGGANWYSSTASDSFTTWIMYRPPANGQGTIYVPIAEDAWDWGGSANPLMGIWVCPTHTYQDLYGFQDTNLYPSWSEQIESLQVAPR